MIYTLNIALLSWCILLQIGMCVQPKVEKLVIGAFSATAGNVVLSEGNHLFLGDPRWSDGQYLIGAGMGALFGGVANGMTAKGQGNSFWSGASPSSNYSGGYVGSGKRIAYKGGQGPKRDMYIPKWNEIQADLEINPISGEFIGDEIINPTVIMRGSTHGVPMFLSAARRGLTFNNGVKEAFIKHFNSGGRHADLGLPVETMATKGMNLIERNMHLLKAGDNTLIGNINGMQKSFKAYVQDGKIISVNMYPGVSNRVTQGTIINFGNVTW